MAVLSKLACGLMLILCCAIGALGLVENQTCEWDWDGDDPFVSGEVRTYVWPKEYYLGSSMNITRGPNLSVRMEPWIFQNVVIANDTCVNDRIVKEYRCEIGSRRNCNYWMENMDKDRGRKRWVDRHYGCRQGAMNTIEGRLVESNFSCICGCKDGACELEVDVDKDNIPDCIDSVDDNKNISEYPYSYAISPEPVLGDEGPQRCIIRVQKGDDPLVVLKNSIRMYFRNIPRAGGCVPKMLMPGGKLVDIELPEQNNTFQPLVTYVPDIVVNLTDYFFAEIKAVFTPKPYVNRTIEMEFCVADSDCVWEQYYSRVPFRECVLKTQYVERIAIDEVAVEPGEPDPYEACGCVDYGCTKMNLKHPARKSDCDYASTPEINHYCLRSWELSESGASVYYLD